MFEEYWKRKVKANVGLTDPELVLRMKVDILKSELRKAWAEGYIQGHLVGLRKGEEASLSVFDMLKDKDG